MEWQRGFDQRELRCQHADGVDQHTNFKGSFIGDGSGLTLLNFNGLLSQTNLGTSGSYTPVIGDGTQNFNGVTQTGHYVNEGNLIHVEIWLTWIGKGTVPAGSTLKISPPFAVGPTHRAILTVAGSTD
jgi:hypothetical protein